MEHKQYALPQWGIGALTGLLSMQWDDRLRPNTTVQVANARRYLFTLFIHNVHVHCSQSSAAPL
jgi:hypothetical protein